jgi:Somatomedin B domain
MRNFILVVSLIGCVPDARSIGQSEERGTWKPTEKSDQPATCAGFCGGRSPGRCWCDVACSGWGDCCPDYQNVCSAPADGGTFDSGWGGTTGGTSGTTGGTTGWGYDGGTGYDSGWGGTTGWGGTGDGGWGGTTGGTSGWGGDIDLSPVATVDAGASVGLTMSVDLTVTRTPDAGDVNIHFACFLHGYTGALLLSCGAGDVPVTIGVTFKVPVFIPYQLASGSLNGTLFSLYDAELTDYGYTDPNGAYSDSWSGVTFVSLY